MTVVNPQQQTQEESKDSGKLFENNIVLVPKFISGIKTDVKESIMYGADDKEVIYPAGHNVIFYNIEDKSQRYISGIEGTQGITAMALSKSKRWLAVAEKHEKAPIITIYDTQTLKKKKYLVSTDIGKSEEFISIAFAPTKEQYLITLTNEPGQTVCIWQWDKAKCISYQPVSNNTNNVLGT